MDQKVISRINKEVDRATLIAMKNVFFLEKKDSQWLDKIFDLLYEELSTDKPSRNIGNGLLQAILHKMLKLSEGQQAKISRSYQIASQFQGLVEQHLHEQQSVEFYANTLSVSGNYLNRCVKATYGKNCKNIIQETAILQSQILLFETQKGISEISYEVGFEDPSHFSRVFKKVCGQTPTDFRKIMMHSSS